MQADACPLRIQLRQYLYLCTSKASTFVARWGGPHMQADACPLRIQLRQYLYLCTSKASTFVARLGGPHMQADACPLRIQLRQYLYLCTSKAGTFVLAKQVTCAAAALDAVKDSCVSICTCVLVKQVLLY
jgi:ribosomal protein S4E